MQDGVVREKHTYEVLGMLFADVFDSEVINTKINQDGTPLARPKTWSELR